MKKRLLLGAFLMGSFFTAQAQLSEDFEGDVFPPEGWELESINPVTWEFTDPLVNVPLSGEQSVTITYDEDLGQQDESLITPSFAVPAGNPSLTFLASLSYYWSISPNDNYDFIVSVSTNDGESWTAIWDETDLGVFTSFATQSVTIPLTAYAGQNVKIKFQYLGADGAQLALDDVAVITCARPSEFLFLEPLPTTTTANIGWTAPATAPTGYEFEYGVLGFTQGSGTTITPTTPVANLTGLLPSTEYSFYVRTNCGGGDYSEWAGPITFGTEFDAATPNYSFGFENETNSGGWSAASDEIGSAWEIIAQDGLFVFSQEGENLAFVGGAEGDSDAWLFSRGLNLTAGQTYTITYYLSKVIGEGAGGVNDIFVTVGSDTTAAAQTTTLSSFVDYQNEEYTLQTSTFTPSTTGVFYVGFNYVSPSQSEDSYGFIALDNFSVTGGTAGIDGQLASQFAVHPNPASNVVNVTANNALINNIVIADINGRTVKIGKFTDVASTQVNISDLASGVYMMTISSDKGTTTKKIVKN